LTLKFSTARKRRHLAALLQAYRAAVNFYIDKLWKGKGAFDGKTVALLEHSRLSYRYRSQALKQACEIVASTRKSAAALGKKPRRPLLRGEALLDAKFVNVENGQKSFDLVVRLSSLHKRRRLCIPTRRTAVLNRWLSVPGAALVQGCGLSEKGLTLWVRLPKPELKESTEGQVLGLDLGANRLVVDSEGAVHGQDFGALRRRIRASKPRSANKRRLLRRRENFIGYHLNRLPWKSLSVLGVEQLRGIKHGKRKGRGKAFRRAIAPWTVRTVLARLGHKAEENRVRLVAVPAAYSSRTCPACGGCEKENRRGEAFGCIRCGYSADADWVGAHNVLVRTLATLGSVESPGP
jgi:hypothetical protein